MTVTDSTSAPLASEGGGDDGGAHETGSAAEGRSRWFAPLATLLVVLVIACIVLGVVAATRPDDSAQDAARTDAVATARQFIVNFDGIRYDHATDDFKRVQVLTTGDFATQFHTSQVQIRKLLTAQKASLSGTVLSSAVVSSDSDQAVVLLAVDRTLKTSSVPAGSVNHERWQATLEKHGNSWLVSGLAAVA